MRGALAWVALALLWLPARAPGTEPAATQRVVREGIAIELAMEPLDPEQAARAPREGDAVRFRFTIRDTATGTPLSGAYPAAWMDLRPEGVEPVVNSCQDKVEAFIGGSLLAQAELDLNVYYVLAMNDDATISVVDPLFGYGTTKLLDMVFLDSPGLDWALSPDQRTLYVSMPDAGAVAVIDTASWEVTANVAVGPRPSRVALQPDARRLFVGHDLADPERSGVSVIDTRELTVLKSIPTGPGRHEIAFRDDDRFAFVTNGDAGTLSIIDARTLEKRKDVEVGAKPVSLAYSQRGQAVYVVDQAGGAIVVVDAEDHEIVARLEAEPGLGQLRFAPGGRLGFVVNPERDVVHILDAALHRIVQTGDVEDGPDHVGFSDELAYVRHRGSDIVLMIPLDEVGVEGRPVPMVDFTGGQAPPGRGAGPADGIVQAPGATAVLVANPTDQAIYYYKEGMAAPMGHFRNYGRQPRAVAVVDRSLRERAPGVYETTARLRRPGRYDVAFFLDAPRTVHCFQAAVAPNPELRARVVPLRVEPLIPERVFAVGEQVPLRFKLSDRRNGAPRVGLRDVRVLTFLAPGIWERRQWAQGLDGGVYQAHFTPPKPGVYYVFVESRSAGLPFNRSRFSILRVTETSAGAGSSE